MSVGEKLMAGCLLALLGGFVGGVIGRIVAGLTAESGDILADVGVFLYTAIGVLIGAIVFPLAALVWSEVRFWKETSKSRHL